MDILLVSPFMNLRPVDSAYKRLMSPPLSLMTLAGLTPRKHRVVIADENVAPLDAAAAPDLVGITVNVDTALRSYELAEGFRKRGIPVVLGGIHASANPEEALAHADAVCVGEAEAVWEQILMDAETKQLRGLYRSEVPADLHRLPLARRELVASRYYLCNDILCATRGCPHTCEFCYNSCDYVHHQYRTRPVAEVVREIQTMRSRHVMFIDDNLIGDLAWIRELLRAIAPLRLRWHAAVSANIGQHPDVMDMMRDSGCGSLFIGFESINRAAVQGVKKRQNCPETYAATIAALHARGIMVNASLAFGFDEDGPDIFQHTLAWLTANRVETMTAHILTPYPGTKLFARLREAGRITDLDWRHYNTSNVVFRPARMTAEELRAGYLWMYDQFYSLPNILRRLPRERGNWIPYLLFNIGYRRLGKCIAGLTRLGLTSAVMSAARRLSYGVE